MSAKFGSHLFRSSLHESGVKFSGVLGANIPTSHTTYADFFISIAWIRFVDCSDRATISANSAIVAVIVPFRLKWNRTNFFICPMTSGEVQFPEYATVKFGSDLASKFCQFCCIVCIRTTSSELPKDGVFGNGSNRRDANKTATFKRVLKFGQSIVPLPVAINAVQDCFCTVGRNLFEPFNGNSRNSPGK